MWPVALIGSCSTDKFGTGEQGPGAEAGTPNRSGRTETTGKVMRGERELQLQDSSETQAVP